MLPRVFALLLLLLPGLAIEAQEAKPRSIRLQVSETAGIRRFGYPVSAVLLLNEPVKDVAQMRLLDGDKPISAQFRPHGDTSKGIRAVSLDFNVNHGPLEKREYVVEYGPDVSGSQPKGGLRVETTDDEFRVIHSSDLQFVVPRDLVGLLRAVRTGKTDYLRPDSVGLIIRDKDDKRTRAGKVGPGAKPIQSEVVKSGPLAVALRFESVEVLNDGKSVSSVVEMDFPLSKSWVRVTWTLADPKGDVAGMGADLNLHVEGEPTLIDFGAGTSVYAQLRRGQSARLRQNPRGRAASTPAWETFVGPEKSPSPFVVAPGSADASARDAEGWAHVMDRERCTAIAVADFAKSTAGAEITVDVNGRLQLWRHFRQPGETAAGSKTLTFWLHFVGMPVQVGAATSPQAMLAPLQVEVNRKR